MEKKAMCWTPSGKRENRTLKAQSLQGAYEGTGEKHFKEGNMNNSLFWAVRAGTNKKGEITRRNGRWGRESRGGRKNSNWGPRAVQMLTNYF
jgi:hypothetical protein